MKGGEDSLSGAGPEQVIQFTPINRIPYEA